MNTVNQFQIFYLKCEHTIGLILAGERGDI